MKKTVVEDCLVLDVSKLNKDRLFDKGLGWYGSFEWADGNSIGYCGTGRPLSNAELQVTLYYQWSEVDVRYNVLIVSTSCHFGGKRYWFICPSLRPDNSACNRRVGKLYKPHHARLFLCRHCHDLSYRSRQVWKSQTDVGLLLQLMGAEETLKMLKPGEQPPARLGKKIEKLIEIANKKGIS